MKMQLKKAHLLFISLFLGLAVFAQAQPKTVDGVAAIVGGDIILKSEIEEQYDVFNRQNFGEEVSYCEVFEELLFQKLLIHHAEIDSVTVGEDEVEANMDRRIQQLIMQMGDQQKLEEFYEKSVVEIKEEMRELIRDQLVAQRMQMTARSLRSSRRPARRLFLRLLSGAQYGPNYTYFLRNTNIFAPFGEPMRHLSERNAIKRGAPGRAPKPWKT